MRRSPGFVIQTVADLPPDEDWFSPWERAHAESLRFPKRLQDWKLGRWTAKLALRRYLEVPSDDLEIRSSRDGAPDAYLCGQPAPISLSISHSRGVALAAVGEPGLALGCDLEFVEARTVEFITDYLTEAEVRLALSAPPDRQPLLCTLIWSAKESALKSLRDGLRRDTKTVSVSPVVTGAEGDWAPLSVSCPDLGRVFEGWWKLETGFVLTFTEQSLPAPPVAFQGYNNPPGLIRS